MRFSSSLSRSIMGKESWSADAFSTSLHSRAGFAGAGAKLICHREQSGVFPLSTHPRERTRGSAGALAEIQDFTS